MGSELYKKGTLYLPPNDVGSAGELCNKPKVLIEKIKANILRFRSMTNFITFQKGFYKNKNFLFI